MRRLVDIDEVIKVAKNTFPQEDVRKIMWVLCHTPTAYDVEKVVAELGNIKVKHSYNPIKDEIMYKGIDLEEVTSIVRKGGVE